MQPNPRSVLVALAGMLAVACAHAPPPAPAPPPGPEASRAAHSQVYVTGSRLPQDVSGGGLCTGLLSTTDNVRVYCQDALRSTGRDHDVAAALRELDPSISSR